MAKSLVWRDLSATQLATIAEAEKPASALAEVLGLDAAGSERDNILAELYAGTLAFAKASAFSAEKTSALFSIVKATHVSAVGDRLTLKRSFEQFRSLLLAHSVERPPHSVGVFAAPDVQGVTSWMIKTYYRHYKLYQYVYTKLFSLDITPAAPPLEAAPVVPPLSEAQPEAEWEEERRVAAEAKAAEEAAAAEAEREAKLKEEYESAIPSEVTDKVQEAVAKELEALRAAMEEKYLSQEAMMLEKIEALEAKVAA